MAENSNCDDIYDDFSTVCDDENPDQFSSAPPPPPPPVPVPQVELPQAVLAAKAKIESLLPTQPISTGKIFRTKLNKFKFPAKTRIF